MKNQTTLTLALALLLSMALQAQTFTEQTGMSFTGLVNARAAWGDYDNDNDLDLMICGDALNGTTSISVTKLYKNNGNNTFSEQVSQIFTGVSKGSISCFVSEFHPTIYARHSFANVLLNKGANIEYISEALGDNNVVTTMHYLANFDDDTVKNWSGELL